MKDIILKEALNIEEDLIRIRRELHKIPELALEEFKTSEFIQKELQKLGLEVKTFPDHTGIIGVLKGTKHSATGDDLSKTILLRADMDSLPIVEENELNYKSKFQGRMHACGHDAHMTWLLGTAMILCKLKHQISGNVKFLFQPAEETVGGAHRMIKDGALENPKVNAVIGAHIWPEFPSGTIGIKKGPLMAAPDIFTLTINGKGGHGAVPHMAIDPISIACQVYMSLQTIVSRHIDPQDPVVITVGKFQGGSAFNIIPNKVELQGTVRTFNNETRKKVPQLMDNIIKGIVESHGGTYNLDYEFRYPPVINNDEMVDLITATSEELLGKDNIITMNKGSMAGEDFSYFQREVPGVFFMVGTKNEVKEITEPLHSAKFQIDEDVLPNASAIFAYATVKYLNNI